MKLCIPSEVLKQHLVVLGKTGKGKSSVLRHIVEHLLAHGKRVCIIDPKGDWWGLKCSADGKSAGFPIIGFGDFKDSRGQDVPINAQSGKHIAELITSGNRPCIIGFRGWMPGQMIKFWLDFAPALFNANSGELYLVGDEFHNFAPKGKIMDPDAGRCLHWSNRIMSEGRGVGLICLIASQRPQKVHNDTLTCCETLIAMGVNHPADRDAVKDWIDGCGDRAQGTKVLDSLAGMARGEAFVWSPEIKFGPERLHFPLFETFDSFAPPQLQKKITGAGWADVDLGVVKEKLATVIEEARANDPAELKREIARLKSEIRKAESSGQKLQPEIIEIPVFSGEELDRLQRLIDAIERFRTMNYLEEIGYFKTAINHKFKSLPERTRAIVNRPAPAPRAAPTNSASHSNGHLPIGERKILQACIQYPDGLRREQLTVLTGYKRSSRDAYIQRLREKELIGIDGEQVLATEHGISALPDAGPLPTGKELQEFWLARLPIGEKAILEVLLSYYPESVSRDNLTSATNYQRSSRDAYLQRLRAKELLTEPSRGEVRAAESLFS